MKAKTRDRGRSSLTSGGVADTGKVLVLLGNEGDGEEAARGPRKPSLVFDEAEGLPCGEMDVKELSLPVYDPNRGRLHPRELYALVHVIFSDTKHTSIST